MVAVGPEPGLEGPLRRPIRTGGLRRSPLSAEHLGRRRRDAGTPDVLPRRHGQAALGVQVQPLHERRAAAPHRLGFTGGRSRERQRVRLQRQRPPDVAVARRQAALGTLARRGVRHVDDARRTRVVSDHRRRSAHRQRPDVQLGTARRRRAPLPLVRQDDGSRQLDQLARRPADRHHLRQPVRRRRQRHAHVLLRRQRRRHARAQDWHRREDLELAGQPARPEHGRVDGRTGPS